MRRKSIKNATFVAKVKSYKGSNKIYMESLYCNDIEEYMPIQYIEERGIKEFLNMSDLKETLNWNLNGYGNRYQFTWGMTSKEFSEGVAYIYCDYDFRTNNYLKTLVYLYNRYPAATKDLGIRIWQKMLETANKPNITEKQIQTYVDEIMFCA